eukprot:3159930-Rhodomonas_salina.1
MKGGSDLAGLAAVVEEAVLVGAPFDEVRDQCDAGDHREHLHGQRENATRASGDRAKRTHQEKARVRATERGQRKDRCAQRMTPRQVRQASTREQHAKLPSALL